MRRLLTFVLLALTLGAGAAHAGDVGVGVSLFGGLSWPVLQEVNVSSFSPSDAFGESGSQFGIRVPVKAIPVVLLEPYYSSTSYGDRTETFNGLQYSRDGYDATAFGLNAILGSIDGGTLKFYPYVGFGSTNLKREGEDFSETGFTFGLGLGISPAEKISIQVRSEFAMLPTGDTSRKFGSLTLGLNYNLLPGKGQE